MDRQIVGVHLVRLKRVWLCLEMVEEEEGSAECVTMEMESTWLVIR